MKTKGVIARFLEVSAVRDHGRNELCRNTQKAYLGELRKFHAFTGGKPASQWSREDVERWLWKLHHDDYSRSARGESDRCGTAGSSCADESLRASF